MSMPWAIVITRPSSEDIADKSLRNAGYRSYLPRYRKIIFPHGAARASNTVLRPLFPGYVFVEDWQGWPERRVLGVDRIMMTGDGRSVAKLAGEDIEMMRSREQAGAFDPPRLHVGDQVAVTIGEQRVHAILEALSPGGRALVRLMMFGRETKVWTATADLMME